MLEHSLFISSSPLLDREQSFFMYIVSRLGTGCWCTRDWCRVRIGDCQRSGCSSGFRRSLYSLGWTACFGQIGILPAYSRLVKYCLADFPSGSSWTFSRLTLTSWAFKVLGWSRLPRPALATRESLPALAQGPPKLVVDSRAPEVVLMSWGWLSSGITQSWFGDELYAFLVALHLFWLSRSSMCHRWLTLQFLYC